MQECLACLTELMVGGNRIAQASLEEQLLRTREESFFEVVRLRFVEFFDNSQEVSCRTRCRQLFPV